MAQSKIKIPFNRPCFVGSELQYIRDAVRSGKISGDGIFTQKCQSLIEKKFGVKKTLLTTSCTTALEMASILIDLKPNDQVIAPSFTFVSTVNAFVLRGAVPKFVDIRPDTLNLDETLVRKSVNKKVKAIFPVHYAGVGCEMDEIMKTASHYGLKVVEDAAQGINAKYKGKYLGTIGDFGTLSFHETKNCISGEGGALLINREKYISRAEMVWEKGTDRCRFFRGEVDKYTWRDIGSSFLPSELISAFLYAQLENLDEIEEKRDRIYRRYHDYLKVFERQGYFRLPVIPKHCRGNAHMFYMVFPTRRQRDKMMAGLKKYGVMSIFHYIPLHLSPMGKQWGYRRGDLPVTESVSERILRLPFYNELSVQEQAYILDKIRLILKRW